MPRISNEAGFSLIELLVTTTILAVLLTIIAVSFQQLNKTARDTKRRSDLQEIRGILENVRTETGEYPASSNEVGGYEYSGDGTFMENVPPQYISRSYADPLAGTDATAYFYRYKLQNLPGCTYELTAVLESGPVQYCPACGITSGTVYCVTD